MVYGNDIDLRHFYILLNEEIVASSEGHNIPVVLVPDELTEADKAISTGYLDPAGWNLTELGAKTIANLHRELGYEATCP